MKVCKNCKTEKNSNAYPKNKGFKDGLLNICKVCKNEKNKLYRQQNPKKVKQTKQKHYNTNKEKVLQWNKAWKESNPAQVKQIRDIYYQDNKLLYRAHNAARRARLLQATPPWSDLDIIKEIYQNCPKGYHVDHIIPLRGKNVCGLHVSTNLQYLTAAENLKKSNKYGD